MPPKKHKYRLQIVLEQKEEAKKEAAIFLAEKRKQLQEEIEKEQKLQDELKENRQRKQQEADEMAQAGLMGGFDAHQAQRRLNFMKRLDWLADELREKIYQQNLVVQRAERARMGRGRWRPQHAAQRFPLLQPGLGHREEVHLGPRSGVLDDVADDVRRRGEIDRYVDEAGEHTAHVGDAEIDVAVEVKRDAVAALQAQVEQAERCFFRLAPKIL